MSDQPNRKNSMRVQKVEKAPRTISEALQAPPASVTVSAHVSPIRKRDGAKMAHMGDF